ncbi:uncharacterized protein [Amphiura filiformis]|uniref:uncharacterized protein n=1 Tax=Amphiura filiformis TaxID=82378 RepID=UPI003B2102D6
MNLFAEVRNRYGQHAVKSIRDLESTERKLVRHRQHLTFTHRCKDNGVTPSSLKIRCPINTEKARNIIRKTEKDLIGERIRVVKNKIKSLKQTQESKVQNLETLNIDDESRRHVDSFLERKRKQEEVTTKERQKQKLKCLVLKQEIKSRSKENTELDLSGTQLKKWREKWVKNISDKELSDPQQKLLARGLNFAVSVDKIPHTEYIVACETACAKLPWQEAKSLRAEVTGMLKSATVPKSNITKEERLAMNELKKSKDLLIMGADKGRCTIVKTTTEYENKVHAMLSDERTYEKLKKDPTQIYKRKLLENLKRLKEEKKIDEGQYRLLYPTAESVPRLYCTTKIHKEGNPIRPIVDYTGSLGYQTSKALAEILGPLVGNTDHHVVNSKQLAEEMTGVLIEENDIFNSHDVVSLFTNTPIDKSLDIIKDRLEKDKTLNTRTNLTPDDIIQLLQFVLTTTYFSFRGSIYRQVFGAAMGSPVSPIVANLFMEWLEQEAITTAPLDCKPKLWRRYVDDILEIINKDSTQKLTDHLNTTDQSGNIKFTYEEEKEGQIPFLDTLLIRKQDGTVKLLVYRKKTHTDQYLSFKSQHPLHQKLGVIRTLMDRKDKIVTEEDDKKDEEQRIRKALAVCEYPKWAMDKVKQQMKDKTTAKPQKKTTETPIKGMVVIPYVEGTSEKLQRVFRKHGFTTAMKPTNTLKSVLVHPKDKKDIDQTSEVVYDIPCKGCNKSYIGETGRPFGVRKKEHQKDTEKIATKNFTRASRKLSTTEQHKSAITDHVAQENHVIDWEGAKLLDRDSNAFSRGVREAIQIRKKGKNSLNRDEDEENTE